MTPDVVFTFQFYFSPYCCSSKIEVAYQEAVALKRQEELIREEEAAYLAGSEKKMRRGVADKDKKSKKKQVRPYLHGHTTWNFIIIILCLCLYVNLW